MEWRRIEMRCHSVASMQVEQLFAGMPAKEWHFASAGLFSIRMGGIMATRFQVVDHRVD